MARFVRKARVRNYCSSERATLVTSDGDNPPCCVATYATVVAVSRSIVVTPIPVAAAIIRTPIAVPPTVEATPIRTHGRHPLRHSHLHPDVSQRLVRQAWAEGSGDHGRVHGRGKENPRRGITERDRRDHGSAQVGPLLAQLDWTCWLWSHGGSIFDKAGMFSGGDPQGLEGLA